MEAEPWAGEETAGWARKVWEAQEKVVDLPLFVGAAASGVCKTAGGFAWRFVKKEAELPPPAVTTSAEAGEPGDVWAIGVDSDQYELVSEELQPYILTSMLKKVDVCSAIMSLKTYEDLSEKRRVERNSLSIMIVQPLHGSGITWSRT